MAQRGGRGPGAGQCHSDPDAGRAGGRPDGRRRRHCAGGLGPETNLAGLTIPLLDGSGEVLAIKGRSAAEEIEKAAKAIRKLGGNATAVVTVGEELLAEPTTVVRILVGCLSPVVRAVRPGCQ